MRAVHSMVDKKRQEKGKVLSLLEACFDLISGSSLHMKIQIMGGKITENLGCKSLLWKVKIFLSFFHFQILYKKVNTGGPRIVRILGHQGIVLLQKSY